jgi:hypothetical protein
LWTILFDVALVGSTTALFAWIVLDAYNEGWWRREG